MLHWFVWVSTLKEMASNQAPLQTISNGRVMTDPHLVLTLDDDYDCTFEVQLL